MIVVVRVGLSTSIVNSKVIFPVHAANAFCFVTPPTTAIAAYSFPFSKNKEMLPVTSKSFPAIESVPDTLLPF